MLPNAVLIQQPVVDFSTFLAVTNQALGYSPSAGVDGCRRQLHDAEKFTSCLSAMKDGNASVSLPPHLMAHVSFSMLVMAEDGDMQDTLEYCAGMPFVRADTLMRGVSVAVITGTLSQVISLLEIRISRRTSWQRNWDCNSLKAILCCLAAF